MCELDVILAICQVLNMNKLIVKNVIIIILLLSLGLCMSAVGAL